MQMRADFFNAFDALIDAATEVAEGRADALQRTKVQSAFSALYGKPAQAVRLFDTTPPGSKEKDSSQGFDI